MPHVTYPRAGDGWVQFEIPDGVKMLRDVEVRGGGSPGRGSGLITGSIDIQKGWTHLLFYIGEGGQAAVGNNGGSGGAAGSRGGGVRVGAGGNGGDGSGGTNRGGDGGGSATAIWVKDPSKPGDLGRLIAVSGGAGGTSGDNGGGGRGGAAIGQDGARGTAGPSGPTWTAATGGRQNQGGFGGLSPEGPGHYGGDAARDRFGRAGNGRSDPWGGGGGGSGFYSGGGGQGGLAAAAGGGGAGGSNYTGGMHPGVQSLQGGGSTGDGLVKFYWQREEGNHPPTPPSNTKVNGKAESPGMAAGSTGRVTISAKIFDSDKGDKVRLVAVLSRSKNFNPARDPKKSELLDVKDKPVLAEVTLDNLDPKTHYYVRLWSEDKHGLRSLNYIPIDFWTNRAPTPPTLKEPPNTMIYPDSATLDFVWEYNDKDEGRQQAFALRYRITTTPTADPRDWIFVGGRDHKIVSSVTSWSIPGDTFKANYTYEWQVRTQDTFNQWSKFSSSRTFTVTAPVTAPELDEPRRRETIESGVDNTFTWRHVDWRRGYRQYTADFRFRVWDRDVPDDDAAWFLIPGTPETPGRANELVVPAMYDFGIGEQVTFEPGVWYAWQVRTYVGLDASSPSQWSESNLVHAIPEAGSGLEPDVPVIQVAAGPLGCGVNRVFVAERGGRHVIGEVTPLSSLQWTRLRDDISTCVIQTAGFADDCGELLARLRCWQHELVVYRDGERVWEGPITRVAYHTDHVEVDAKDPMVYVYRRVMRVGYNDTYRKIHGVVVNRHGRSVVERATRIIQNALGYDDPNVLPYLTRIDGTDDATQARTIAAYQKTAWEEVDDLAATAALDYTTVGRRIILNDTHNAIGQLPVMRAGDFSQDPVVTEYGMSLANAFYVSSSRGQWGVAYPSKKNKAYADPDHEHPLYYPFVEQLASAYGESADDPRATVTADKRMSLSEKLREQAASSIRNRWPAPLLVRVPDNSLLSPDLQIGINQLVPGVWIPVQATGTLRVVTQWQKLDSVTVTQSEAVPEQISVILSPAPLGEQDPDSGSGAGDDSESL